MSINQPPHRRPDDRHPHEPERPRPPRPPYPGPYPPPGGYPPPPYPGYPPPVYCPRGGVPYALPTDTNIFVLSYRLGVPVDTLTYLNPGLGFQPVIPRGTVICLPRY